MAKSSVLSSVMTASQARANFFDIAEEASRFSRRFTITVHGKPAVVVMSLDELEGMEETIDIMSDPKLMRDLRKSEADLKAGRVYPLEDVIKELENKVRKNETHSYIRSEKAGKKTFSTRKPKSQPKTSSVGKDPSFGQVTFRAV